MGPRVFVALKLGTFGPATEGGGDELGMPALAVGHLEERGAFEVWEYSVSPNVLASLPLTASVGSEVGA